MSVGAVHDLPARRVGSDGRAHVDFGAVFRLAAPLMLTNAIQAVLNLTDTWFVGRLSAEALAGMSAIYWIMSCVILIFGGVGLAVQTFVSQAVGSRRGARAAQAVWNAVWAALAAVPLFVAMAFAGPLLLRPFSLDPEVERLALAYWEPRMLGAALGSMVWAFAGFFNGVGATRVTLIVSLTVMIANVPANQFFMFGLDLGMAGAAWGTNAAQATGLLLALWFVRSREFAVRYRTRIMWRPRLDVIWRQLKVGLPIGVMYGADVLGVALLQLMIVQIGTAPAAATQIVMMLTSLAYMPTLGIATAGTTLVGQSIGAGHREWAARIGTAVIGLCAGLMALIALLLLATGPWLVPKFVTANDAEAAATIATGLLLLWPAAAYQVFDGLYFGSGFALRAAGDTRVPAASALLLSWFLFVPLAHTLVFAPGQGWIDGLPQLGWGALGGWIALMIYAVLLGSTMFLRWRSGRWRRIVI